MSLTGPHLLLCSALSHFPPPLFTAICPCGPASFSSVLQRCSQFRAIFHAAHCAKMFLQNSLKAGSLSLIRFYLLRMSSPTTLDDVTISSCFLFYDFLCIPHHTPWNILYIGWLVCGLFSWTRGSMEIAIRSGLSLLYPQNQHYAWHSLGPQEIFIAYIQCHVCRFW